MIVALLATNLERLLGVTFLIHPAPKLLYLTMIPATLLAFARTKPFFSLFSPLTLCVLWVLAALTKSELTNQNFDPNLFFWWTPLLFLATESSWPTSSKWGLAAVWTIIALTGLSQLANDDFKPIGLAMLAGFEIHLQLRGRKRRRTLLDSLPPKRITENPKMVAVRLCAKKPDSLEIISRFHGVENCRLSHHLDCGRYSCPHACLGFGDCKLACPFGAIGPSKQAGEPPALYPRLCRGCGSCVAACPQAIMVLREVGSKFLVQCSGTAFIKQMDRLCPVGCLGCSRCRKACPAGAVSRRGHQAPPQVDEEKCAAHWPQCGQACRASCPRDLPKFVSQAQGEKSQEDMNGVDEPTNG
jgi:Fe-S-cluster-containing hydrogenase component 2